MFHIILIIGIYQASYEAYNVDNWYINYTKICLKRFSSRDDLARTGRSEEEEES